MKLEKLAVHEGQLLKKLQAVANEVNDEYVKKWVKLGKYFSDF